MRPLLAALMIVTGWGPLACAEPLEAKRVSADAKWLVHIDVDAMKAGKIPSTLGEHWLGVPSAQEDLKKWSKAIGMDPTKDLHSILIYGNRYAQPDAVVIVGAAVDRERLRSLLRTRPDYRTDSYGDRELIIWTEKKGKNDEHTVTGCFYQPAVIVFGRDGAAVKKALDVLDGASPALTESNLLFTLDVPAGTMIQVRATELADVQQFKSPLVQQSKSLVVALGEGHGEAFVVAKLVTESADVARRVRAVVAGFRAMAELQFESDQDALKILEAVKVSGEEKTVSVECRGPTDDVAKLAEKLWTKQPKQKRAD
jgi:hypothetical protein